MKYQVILFDCKRLFLKSVTYFRLPDIPSNEKQLLVENEALETGRHLQEELEQRRLLQEDQRRYLPDELEQRRLLMLSTATPKFENGEEI